MYLFFYGHSLRFNCYKMSESMFRCALAHPYSEDIEKLTPKIYSLVRKCDTALKADTKNPYNKRGILKGIKEITKLLLSKKSPGKAKRSVHSVDGALIVLGGDVSPSDVLSHIPKIAEEAGVPYIWVPSRKDLGIAAGSRRPTSIVLLEYRDDYAKSLSKCIRATQKLTSTT